MALQISLATAISLFVTNRVRAQSGAHCFSNSCPTPGHIRLDAVIENGQLVGGCDCVCDPSTADDPASCQFPATYSESVCGCVCPYWAPDPLSCESPTQFIPATCQCAGPVLGRVGGPCTVNGQLLGGSTVRSDCSCDEGGDASVQCPGNQEVNPITGRCQCPGNQEVDSVSGLCQCPEKTPEGTWYPLCRYPLAKDPISCDCVPSGTSSPTKMPTASPDRYTLQCECIKRPPSPYCCLTAIDGFTPNNGRCWGHQDEASCEALDSLGDNQCKWDPSECLPNPPVNSMDPSTPCLFRDSPCALDSDCCSEVCRSNGFCR